MDSDVKQTAHRRLEMAFQSAAKARNEGAQHVTIEWAFTGLFASKQYAFEKTADGLYARLRGVTDANELMRVHNFALQHGLPFSPSASWARTDGIPVTAEVL